MILDRRVILVKKKIIKSVSYNKCSLLSLLRSTGGLASILKDSGEVKFSKEEQSLTCCILCTADYCLETTQQVKFCLYFR